MPRSDASSEASPSIAELTAVAATSPRVAAVETPTEHTPTAAATNAAAEQTYGRMVFPVTILGPTNSSNQSTIARNEEHN